jgi:hypothetical protein
MFLLFPHQLPPRPAFVREHRPYPTLGDPQVLDQVSHIALSCVHPGMHVDTLAIRGHKGLDFHAVPFELA